MTLAVARQPGLAPVDRSVRERSIGERFLDVVRAHAGRPAVGALTYDELEQASRRLAAAIRERVGTAIGERVALLLGDPTQQVVAIFAALRAGQAFVPLDPSHPPARLRAILTDCEPRAIIAADLDAARSVAGETPCLAVGAGDARGWIEAPVPPATPACLLYTSGSTGAPKGVVHTHASLLHAFMNSTLGLRLGPEDRLTMLGSITFAATLSDLFGALLNGAALLPYRLAEQGIAGLPAWLARERATVYFSVPSVFRRMTELLVGDKQLAGIRLVKLAGEPVLRGDLERFRRHFARGSRLLNSLGCTEMNVVRQYFLDHDTVVEGGTLPVGYPVADTEVVLVDGDGRELPPGQVGEIVIRSPYLAAGYWRRPGGGFEAGAFHTGDLGRLSADGLLEHLGRKDRQVKISGVRIEPAEIEGALVDEGLAREAAVVAWQGKLAAYLVPRAPGLDPAEVRRRLRARLPAIMVPPLVIMLEELPRTASGKLDHKALPAPEEPARNVARVAGRDQAEELLLGALRRAAGRDVGLTEDIFEAGLDSLAALAFCARVEVVLGRRLPLEVLVEARTVERLARALRADAPERPSPTLVPFRTEGTVPPFFCVHPRPGHVFAYLGLAHHLGEEIPFYGLQARGLDGREPPQRDLGEMVASYLGEVRRTQPRGPYHLGGFCAGGVIAMEMARALVAQGESVALLVLCDTKFPRHGLSRLAGELGRARRVLRAPLSTAFRLARRLLRGRAAVPGTGTRGEARLRQIMESILRSYRPQPYAGSLLVVESTRVASDQRFASPRTWVGVASREREVVELAFGHDELLQEPAVQTVAAHIRRRLLTPAR